MSNALKPVPFKEANRELHPLFATPNRKSIRVYSDGEACISCWHLTFLQRLSVLVFGRIWLSIKSGQSMPGTWLSCGRTCFVKPKETARRRESTSNRSAVAFAAIAIVSLIVAIGLALYSFSNPPPMTGHISGKNHHPVSYPVTADTPWVYVLSITNPDSRQACTWIVDEDTYDSYSVGDDVKRGVHGNDNDTAATPSQGAS